MGDTPSFAWLLYGDLGKPEGESWGGSYTCIDRSARKIFKGNSTIADTVATYAIIEWQFKGPELNIPADSACFKLVVAGQEWPGYYLGQGNYAVRYSPKQAEMVEYTTTSAIPDLHGQKGRYVSVTPWPGKKGPDDYLLGKNWYSDRQEATLFIGNQQGAKTIAKYRTSFLMDWAKRWDWLKPGM
jgi:hypothetical protein